MTTESEIGFVPGRGMRVLTAEEVEQAKALAETTPVDPITYGKLPRIEFPIRVRLVGSRASWSGDIGGMTFKEGVSTVYHPYRRVMSLSAAYGAIEDLKSGISIYPQAESVAWIAENKRWNYGRPMPEHQAGEVAMTKAAAIIPPPHIIVPLTGRITAPEVKPEPNKVVKLRAAISNLRPGHKEDWTSNGMPDANRLATMIGEKVSKGERDAAWTLFQQDRLDGGAIADAFAMPADAGDVRKVLEAIGRQKGNVYLLQALAKKGSDKEPREQGETIDALIEAGITIEEAKVL